MPDPDPPDDGTRVSPPRPDPAAGTSAAGAWAATGPSSIRPMTPVRLGRFELRELLGEGAFGRVFLAFDPELERQVAIKVPHRDGLTPAFRERFLREARATATIHHPNVCPVYDVGTEGDLPYIVMHFVVGGTLAGLLERLEEPLPPRHALAIARKLALGMAAAHAQGVIHRDLKPQNVLYDKTTREVLVTDFGLARVTGDSAHSSESDGQREKAGAVFKTVEGSVFGTPAYMSPEQARGRQAEVGPLSDVYALGVILYRMLTGDVPFHGSVYEVMMQHVETAPHPPSAVRRDIDPKLDALCLKAMTKTPSDRYPSAKAFASALADYLRAGEQVGVEPAPLFEVVSDAESAPTASPLNAITPTKPGGLIRPLKPQQLAPVPVSESAPPTPPEPASEAKGPTGRRRPPSVPERKLPGATAGRRRAWIAVVVVLLAGVGIASVRGLMPNRQAPNGSEPPTASPGTSADLGAKKPKEPDPKPKAKEPDPVGAKPKELEPKQKSPPDTAPPLNVDVAKTEPGAGDVVEVEIAPGVKMRLCWVPAGEARLGSTQGERLAVMKHLNLKAEPEYLATEAEEKRGVFKTKGFWLGKYEVTQEEWEAVMGTNPSCFSAKGKGKDKVKGVDTRRLPAEQVSWDDCQTFAKKLNANAKLPAAISKGRFALPHENEWEYACRGGRGNATAFYFGNELNRAQANSDVPFPGVAPKGSALGRTAVVGGYEPRAPHPWGLCDMSGNVSEWCENKYADGRPEYVRRGGSWDHNGHHCRAADRVFGLPGSRPVDCGCRVCYRPD